MRDVVGKELAVGDDVIFTAYNRHGLTKGKVLKFSTGDAMVVVEYDHYGHKRTTKKTSDYVVKV